jgi:hypothetical protein
LTWVSPRTEEQEQANDADSERIVKAEIGANAYFVRTLPMGVRSAEALPMARPESIPKIFKIPVAEILFNFNEL